MSGPHVFKWLFGAENFSGVQETLRAGHSFVKLSGFLSLLIFKKEESVVVFISYARDTYYFELCVLSYTNKMTLLT